MPNVIKAIFFGLATSIAAAVPSTFGADDQFFRQRIAPILERRCLQCHGDSTRKGNLSLATASAAFKGGDGGPAIVPGKPGESLLLEMISGEKPAMPRKDKPLSREEVAAVREWIESGAAWPAGLTLADRRLEGQRWWAFEPLESPKPPRSRSTWVRTPIDAFILAELEKHGLKPSRQADRRTLIRRLSFDLIGLPPTPDEVEHFLKDESPNAYETLVDRLLASPHYGERWGRHWLDVVHFGDTHGYDKDKRRDHAWPYRDYVIAALNRDLSYGRFIREQIAGDVLAPGDPSGVIATGFIAAGPWDFVGHVELREGTIDKLKTRLLDRDDMVSSTISTFVSLTVHCARCHDHKFDPIPQADYYRLQAVFAGVDRGDRPYGNPEITARRAVVEDRRKAVSKRYSTITRKIEKLSSPALARLDDQIAALRGSLTHSPALAIGRDSPSNGYHSAIHQKPDTVAWVQLDLGSSVPLDEIRLVPARPTDFPDTPGFGFPARFTVAIADEASFARAEQVASHARPDNQNASDEPYVIRPGGRKARYIRVTGTRLWKRLQDYVFALSELEVISQGVNRARTAAVTSLDSIEAGRWGRERLVDGFDSRHMRPVTTDSSALARYDLLFRLEQAQEERNRLAEALIDPELNRERDAALAELTAIDSELLAVPQGHLVYSIQQHAPRPIAVLRRGEVDQPGAVAVPGSLACMPFLPALFDLTNPNDEGSRRAALAEWLASPKNVLTWRSIANRLWHYHFGRGLVETPNDFGRNGARPTHPELLDWLAAAIRDNGQSLKALHRLIVCSAVYRQVTSDNTAYGAIDADNRFLWRQNRRRLDAEAVRDSVLAVAGTLDRRMGGPGFEPFSFKDDHSPVYDHSDPARIDGPQVRRRAIYRFIVRSVPNPFMEALDCADPNLNTPVRSQTLTALQALALWNDLFMLRQSQELARRLERQSAGIRPQIMAAFRLAFGREPDRSELDSLAAYATKHNLADACRVLFNANEFVFVD
jgi:mono/diheme cytochrome c family protein